MKGYGRIPPGNGQMLGVTLNRHVFTCSGRRMMQGTCRNNSYGNAIRLSRDDIGEKSPQGTCVHQKIFPDLLLRQSGIL